MAHTYTRTVTVVPSDDNYEWQNPAGWITITQVGSSDTWEITVSDNTTSQNRSAILTVNHSDGATTNSITVNQAGTGGVQASPTPSASAIPPTPTPSASTIPPTPTPSSSSGPTLNPTFTFDSGTLPTNRDTMSQNALYSDVNYTITNDGMTSPVPPSSVDPSNTGGWIMGDNQSGPDGTNDPTIFTGVYRFTKQQSGSNNQNVNVTVPGPYSISDTWYVTLEFGGFTGK